MQKRQDAQPSRTPHSLLVRLRYGGGSDSDWEQFCGIYAPMAFRLARKWGLGREDAQDVAASVMRTLFVRMRRGFRRKGSRGAFRSYVATLTRTAVRDLRRAIHRHTGGVDRMTNLRDLKVNTPPEQLERLETVERLRYCLAQVRASRAVRQRTWEVFEAFVLKSKTAKTVSRRYGVTVDHVYVIKNEMLVRIRDRMARLEADFRETP